MLAALDRTPEPADPVRHQRVRGASAAVLAALLLLLVGCGGSATPENPPPSTDPAAWASKFCDALVSLQELPNIKKISASDPKALATKLGELADGLQKASDDLDRAGTPPSKAAEDAVKKFKETFALARDASTAAKTKIEALKSKDSASIATATKERDKAVTAFNEAGKKLATVGNDKELDTLLRATPSCQKFGGSTSASASKSSSKSTTPSTKR